MDKNKQELILNEFKNDTSILGIQADNFLNTIYPSYMIPTSDSLISYTEDDSAKLLDKMSFYRIASCTVESDENLFFYINEKIQKFLTAIHSMNVTIAYGVVSSNGVTNIVIGINEKVDVDVTKSIMEGLLSGIELEEFSTSFSKDINLYKEFGLITGIPTTKIDEDLQTFDLAPIMQSLNGENYTMLFIAKPIRVDSTVQKLNTLMDIKDNCFAISKRNISRQSSLTDTEMTTENKGETFGNSTNKSNTGTGAVVGGIVGGAAGTLVGQLGVASGVKLGITLGSLIGASSSSGKSYSNTEGYSEAISKAITSGEGISSDIQNSFAIELMNYTEEAINRFKKGKSNGMWQTTITYSADSMLSRNIIQACLCGEISKPNPDILPLRAFSPVVEQYRKEGQQLLIPQKLLSENKNTVDNPLCSYINSSELGLLCTLPIDSVPDFEIRYSKRYPMVSGSVHVGDTTVEIGKISDGQRVIESMPFVLGEYDLNKHTFICGMTGSGKTTTVKGILRECKKPFMVIESAKKEYRNIKLTSNRKLTTYTLGKPEINCLKINPFYILPGISPQTHIDFLKDLFNASFSFYGPMPYILEKCLHNIYINKGWNLTLGFHPYLVNKTSSVDFFDIDFIKGKYNMNAHKLLFPNMQELKNEVQRYIEEEMAYEGEVAGNIKTAIKARLDSLCYGAKGYMFNTNEYVDFKELLENNIVFELEGLADDSDKAFCVGLLVIFINEYRQVHKELQRNKKLELEHLLVIEEAHRLLKNVEIEGTSEQMGNPKGKAVEHFTNMIAELRSYGQGVIIAEQIPSKLAPDVIKNSSNKIIQRMVSLDDQITLANTVGIHEKDAINIGALKTGYALCHKEGMSLPVNIKVNMIEENYISDELLFNKNIDERMYLINLSMIKECLSESVDKVVYKLLNTILIETEEQTLSSIKVAKQMIEDEMKLKNIRLILCDNPNNIISEIINESMMKYLLNGTYSISRIMSDKFYTLAEDLIKIPSVAKIAYIKIQLYKKYDEDIKSKGIHFISETLKNQHQGRDISKKTIRNYFIECSDKTVNSISILSKGGC